MAIDTRRTIYYTYSTKYKWYISYMKNEMTQEYLDKVLWLLNGRLALNDSPSVGLVVCGGAAMIATGLTVRTTTDVDIVALMDENQQLIAPVPLPEHLLRAAHEVAATLDLPQHWLNNGPSRDDGGLFQMGLPKGFAERLHKRIYGSHLRLHFIDRVDQIHFKLYAAVDRGGYHISDLTVLSPSNDELVSAARWAFTHDVSSEFRTLLIRLLKELGYEEAAAAI